MKRVVTALAVAAVVGAGSLAQAAVLASWNFNGISPAGGPSPFAATYQDPAVTSTGITRVNVGGGSTDPFGADRFTWGGDGGLPAYNANTPDHSVGIDLTKYISFTVAPTSGPIALDSIDLQVGIQDSNYQQVEGSPPVAVDYSAQYELRWSLDNFASTLAGGNPGDARGTAMTNIPLTGASNITSPVEFRVYAYAAANGYETAEVGHNTAGDGLVVNGTAGAVPEPASLGVLGLGGLALLRRRR